MLSFFMQTIALWQMHTALPLVLLQLQRECARFQMVLVWHVLLEVSDESTLNVHWPCLFKFGNAVCIQNGSQTNLVLLQIYVVVLVLPSLPALQA